MKEWRNTKGARWMVKGKGLTVKDLRQRTEKILHVHQGGLRPYTWYLRV